MFRRLGLLVLVVFGLVASPAAADSLRLYTKPAQPVGGELIEVHAVGTTSFASPAVALTVKNAPASCAADPADDSGGTGITPDGPNGPGPFDAFANDILVHGQYVICGWLYDQSGQGTTVAASISITVINGDRVSISTAPRRLVDGQPATIRASWVTDANNGAIAATVKRGTGACAPTPGQDSGTKLPQLSTGYSVGPETEDLAPRIFVRGVFRLCAWLLDANKHVLATGSSSLLVSAPRGAGGLYQGRTSQRFGLSLAVFQGQIYDFATRARYRCTNRGQPTGSIIQPLTLDGTLYLSDASLGGIEGNGGTIEINYKFSVKGGRAQGVLRERYISTGGNLCDSGTLRFSATRR